MIEIKYSLYCEVVEALLHSFNHWSSIGRCLSLGDLSSPTVDWKNPRTKFSANFSEKKVVGAVIYSTLVQDMNPPARTHIDPGLHYMTTTARTNTSPASCPFQSEFHRVTSRNSVEGREFVIRDLTSHLYSHQALLFRSTHLQIWI